MVELLPNATYFGRMGGKQSRKEQPDNRQKTRKNLNDNTGKDKSPNNGIKLRGDWGRRGSRKFGYDPETGRKNIDPESMRHIRNDHLGEKEKAPQKVKRARRGNGERTVKKPSRLHR